MNAVLAAGGVTIPPVVSDDVTSCPAAPAPPKTYGRKTFDAGISTRTSLWRDREWPHAIEQQLKKFVAPRGHHVVTGIRDQDQGFSWRGNRRDVVAHGSDR